MADSRLFKVIFIGAESGLTSRIMSSPPRRGDRIQSGDVSYVIDNVMYNLLDEEEYDVVYVMCIDEDIL